MPAFHGRHRVRAGPASTARNRETRPPTLPEQPQNRAARRPPRQSAASAVEHVGQRARRRAGLRVAPEQMQQHPLGERPGRGRPVRASLFGFLQVRGRLEADVGFEHAAA